MAPRLTPSASLRPRALTRSLFQTRQLAQLFRRSRLVLGRSHGGTRPNKRALAARPRPVPVRLVIMDPVPFDLIDLPDKQTVAVKIPSTDNQVPRFDFLCAAHSTTVLMSQHRSNFAPKTQTR